MLLQNTDSKFMTTYPQLTLLCPAHATSNIWFVTATSGGLVCRNLLKLSIQKPCYYCFLSLVQGCKQIICDCQPGEQTLSLSVRRALCPLCFPESR